MIFKLLIFKLRYAIVKERFPVMDRSLMQFTCLSKGKDYDGHTVQRHFFFFF
jgi:hypothetical protein